RALVLVAVEALMSQIHMVAVTIKQGPEAIPGERPHHVVVGRELDELWHTRRSHATIGWRRRQVCQTSASGAYSLVRRWAGQMSSRLHGGSIGQLPPRHVQPWQTAPR